MFVNPKLPLGPHRIVLIFGITEDTVIFLVMPNAVVGLSTQAPPAMKIVVLLMRLHTIPRWERSFSFVIPVVAHGSLLGKAETTQIVMRKVIVRE